MLDRNVNNNLKGADGRGRNPRHPVLNDLVRLMTPTALLIPHLIVMGLAAKYWENVLSGTPFNGGFGGDGAPFISTPEWALIAFVPAVATAIFDYISVFGHHPTDRFYQRQEHQYDGLMAVTFQHTKTLVFHAVSLALNTLAMVAGIIEIGFASKSLRVRHNNPAVGMAARNVALCAFMIIAGAASVFTWMIKLIVLRVYNDTPYVTPVGAAPAGGQGAGYQAIPVGGAYGSVYPQTGPQAAGQQQYAVVNQNAPIVP